MLDTVIPAAGTPNPPSVALLQCADCGARFSEPLVSFDYHDVDPDGIATRYYVEQGAGIDVMLEPLSMLDERPVRRYLEVGCGFGFGMAYARRILGWDVLGYDPGAIASAGKRMLDLPIEAGRFDEQTVPARSFDLLFCSEVIEHVSDPNAFIDSLRHALRDDGVLLLTTPDGDAIFPGLSDEVLAPILSPGQHVILYNTQSIENLLRRHGFREIRVRKNAAQLQIMAAMTPSGAPAPYFTRDNYRRFLATELDIHRDDQCLVAGFGYRLMFEDVNQARFDAARAIYERLRAAYRAGYGYDIEAPETVEIPPDAGASLAVFGRSFPFNLCGVWYGRGIIALLGERAPQAATGYFAAAIDIGETLRSALRAIGTDDAFAAELCRAASMARLSAFVQYAPSAAVEALDTLRETALADGSPSARLHLTKAARQVFVDLVRLGYLNLADRVLTAGTPAFGDMIEPPVIPEAMAWSRYRLLEQKDLATAIEAFASLRGTVLAERLANPERPELAEFLAEIELAQLRALAQVDRPGTIAFFREITRNRGRLDARKFADHFAQVCRTAPGIFAELGDEH